MVSVRHFGAQGVEGSAVNLAIHVCQVACVNTQIGSQESISEAGVVKRLLVELRKNEVPAGHHNNADLI